MSNITKEQLEEFIDRTSLGWLLWQIAEVCEAKSQYIRHRGEPRPADWSKAADRIIGLANSKGMQKFNPV